MVFFLRDPIARFVSGFLSRQRKGQPRNPDNLDTSLDEVALDNLREWYKADLAFVEVCRQLAIKKTPGI